MRYAVDEIIGGHVRSHAGGSRSFLWPGEMAVVAIEFLGRGANIGKEADQQVRQRGFVRVLREVDTE